MTKSLLTDNIICIERTFPSANSVILRGERPILIDTGFGSDTAETASMLTREGIEPHNLALIVNTHAHSDHVGGNHFLQTIFNVPIAAHAWDAAMVNRRAKDTCSAEWLDQPIAAYTVTQTLQEGEEITTEAVVMRVLHTPAHTLGHIALYDETAQILISGDVLQAGDVGWLNPFHEGSSTLDRALEVLERFAGMPIKAAFGGHGGVMLNPQDAIRDSIRRYSSWLAQPEKQAWHAMKRIFAYCLMLRGGIMEQDVKTYLLKRAWVQDFSLHVFKTRADALSEAILTEMLRSGAAVWKSSNDAASERVLCAAGLHRVPVPPVGLQIAADEIPSGW